ncbi:MAG: hypothetical protein UMV23_05355 [Halanaerobium sp.]|nr:hypothetical protein [Halanaerobium sp.]
MEIRRGVIIPLGYGKYARSDKIVALEPIEEERGPGRRTRVYVEQLDRPIIASRTENTILANMVQVPAEIIEATAALELLQDLLDSLEQVGPMLRKSIKREARLDLDQFEDRIKEVLEHDPAYLQT